MKAGQHEGRQSGPPGWREMARLLRAGAWPVCAVIAAAVGTEKRLGAWGAVPSEGSRAARSLPSLSSPWVDLNHQRMGGGANRSTLGRPSGAIRSSYRSVTGANRPSAEGACENPGRLAGPAETRFLCFFGTFVQSFRFVDSRPTALLARGLHIPFVAPNTFCPSAFTPTAPLPSFPFLALFPLPFSPSEVPS